MSARGHTTWQIWGAPIVLALLSTFGLLAALLGVGVWHGLAWIALTAPVVVCLWYSLRRRPAPRP